MDNKPTREEAIKESLILWRELATNPEYDVPEYNGVVKRAVLKRLVGDGVLPQRALQYENSCPLCAFGKDDDCSRCPWPGTGEFRCERVGLYAPWVRSTCHATARPVFELMKQLAKGEEVPTFKVGDRVKLVNLLDEDDDDYVIGRQNPLWGGDQGKVRGTVKHFDTDESYCVIHVKWDNGYGEDYNPRNLALLTAEEDRVQIVAGQLYRHEDQVILATDDADDDSPWIYFYSLDGHYIAGYSADSDVFTGPDGREIHRNKLIPTGKSFQDLYARAQ